MWMEKYCSCNKFSIASGVGEGGGGKINFTFYLIRERLLSELVETCENINVCRKRNFHQRKDRKIWKNQKIWEIEKNEKNYLKI